MLDSADLDDSQRYIVSVARRWKAVLVAMTMGGGKTAAMLKLIRELLDEQLVKHVLIIAPPRVASDTWPDEIAKWRFSRPLHYVVLDGSPFEREWELIVWAEVTIISRENWVWLFLLIQKSKRPWPFDVIVWDESSSLRSFALRKIQKVKKSSTESEPPPAKSRGTKKERQWTRFGALAAVRGQVKYMIELSGTAAPGGLIDLGGQIFILDGGKRLGPNKTTFENRWFQREWHPNQNHPGKLTPFPHAFGEIMDRVRDVMIHIPPKPFANDTPRFVDVPIRLTPKLMREYKEFARTLVAEEYDVEAVNQGVLVGKLTQFCNGGLYKEKKLVEVQKRGEWVMDWERSVVPVHSLKLDALESVIEEAAGNPMLIAYGFEFDRAAILKRFPSCRLIAEEKNGLKDWNEGKVELALVHPAQIGHGTNLQFGGHLLCWYGLTWNPEWYDQLNMRLPRRGQTHEVWIYRIIARGTIEEKMIKRVRDKGDTQADINDAVRVTRREIEKELTI